PPVPARTAAFIIPAEEQPGSRSRLYTVLGGIAVVVGVGIGVVVSSTRAGAPVREARDAAGPGSRPGQQVAGAGPGRGASRPAAGSSAHPAVASGTPRAPEVPLRDAGVPATDPPGLGSGGAVTVTVKPVGTVQDLVLAQHAAIARADRKALAGLLAAGAFG